MTRRAASALVIALLVGLAACSSSPEDDATATTTSWTSSTTATTAGPAGTAALEFRPVLADQASTYPCTAKAEGEGAEVLPNRPDPDEDPLSCTVVGPVGFDGTALATVEATEGGSTGDQWVVSVTVAAEQRDKANRMINACFLSEATCRTQAIAIVVDGEVISAPMVQIKDLADDEFVINGGDGGFTEAEAQDLVDRIAGR